MRKFRMSWHFIILWSSLLWQPSSFLQERSWHSAVWSAVSRQPPSQCLWIQPTTLEWISCSAAAPGAMSELLGGGALGHGHFYPMWDSSNGQSLFWSFHWVCLRFSLPNFTPRPLSFQIADLNHQLKTFPAQCRLYLSQAFLPVNALPAIS